MLQIFLEVIETHFVSIFILPIILGILLNSIVCQVNIFVVKVLNIELLTAGSNVAILIEIAFKVTVDRGHQAITPEVEFTIVNQ